MDKSKCMSYSDAHWYFCAILCMFGFVECQCRLRDITYSAPIIVDIEYMRQGKTVVNKVTIGRSHTSLLYHVVTSLS